MAASAIFPLTEAITNNSLFSVCVNVVRLDQIDGIGSGNKYFKLKYNVEQAKTDGFQRLISFGGAYSNHIHALALLGKKSGFETIGLIRGERHDSLNETLSDAVDAGMELHYFSRGDYRRRYDPDFLQALEQKFPNCYWIPEGGSNALGVRGCMDIGDYIEPSSNLIVLPCATATTMAGIAAACPRQRILGISVLKNAHDLEERVRGHLVDMKNSGYIETMPENWSVEHGYHCGGFAKLSAELTGFLGRFEKEVGLPVEPVYSGKMFFAISDLLSTGKIPASARITAIHTGGMQGLRGMRSRLDYGNTIRTN